MFSRFTHAIVRPPARSFADGLTTASLGAPDVDRALEQHAAYCRALEQHGCTLTVLPADDAHPDSTFVEDTVLVLPGRGAILTRPGAPSREGEVTAMLAPIAAHFSDIATINAPGTLDAGDVCEAEALVLIGISHRTNDEGARQLAAWLSTYGIASRTIDIRDVPGILHLKSGLVALDRRVAVAIDALATHPALHDFEVIRVAPSENYAANCVRVNDVVFVAEGFPILHDTLRARGYTLVPLAMQEFEKMDGGLSCLSVRF
ncbi:MAG: hypothetical protein K2X99_02870 [Gemmatimonadaceae bacterium]|nr:hypothetical protein [Gemmatimonadaceae bacterium]